MDLTALRSLKGLAGMEHDDFTQTLVNVVYGMAIEINKLEQDIEDLKKEAQDPKPNK